MYGLCGNLFKQFIVKTESQDLGHKGSDVGWWDWDWGLVLSILVKIGIHLSTAPRTGAV